MPVRWDSSRRQRPARPRRGRTHVRPVRRHNRHLPQTRPDVAALPRRQHHGRSTGDLLPRPRPRALLAPSRRRPDPLLNPACSSAPPTQRGANHFRDTAAYSILNRLDPMSAIQDGERPARNPGAQPWPRYIDRQQNANKCCLTISHANTSAALRYPVGGIDGYRSAPARIAAVCRAGGPAPLLSA